MHLDEWHEELRAESAPSLRSTPDPNDKIHPVIRVADPDTLLEKMVEAFNTDLCRPFRSAFDKVAPTSDPVTT